jgi:hypothetical protein
MSIVKKLNRTEIESIYSAANSAIWYSHNLANFLAKSAREEDYVATLVTDGVPRLGSRWDSLLAPKGFSLQISGVFCHGHPQVSFGANGSQVELADLLVVHQHVGKVRTTSRAMLVQAKMSLTSTHRLPAGDEQLDLYTNWPKFAVVTGGLAPGLRDLKEAGKGSRYALVLDEQSYPEQITWADQCPWSSCNANQLLTADRSFAKLLGDMLLGKDGRAVQLQAPKDDWSRMIKELLEVTGKRTYKRKNIGRGDTPRRSPPTPVPSGLMFVSQSTTFTRVGGIQPGRAVSDIFFGNVPLVETDGHDSEPPELEGENSSQGGISSLIMETRETEQ